VHLTAIRIGEPQSGNSNVFPFNIPAIRPDSEIGFTTPVTFLVGENGSGKSTLLEAVAYAADLITVGSEGVTSDETLAAVRDLADVFRLVWKLRTRKGFFLRAEDFFGYIKRLAQMRAELELDLRQVDKEYADRSAFAKGLARMAYQRELGAMQQQYDRDLNSFSHGESFLELFQSRFVPGGMYLLDEPEVPLSPSRQLTLISMMKQMVAQECQFIIATHSPILMAFPGATILSMDETPLQPVAYETLDHVVITRSFLNDPEQYLRYL
jgi:predicted ATPase